MLARLLAASRRPSGRLHLLGLVSVVGYLVAALGLRAASHVTDVTLFLALFGGLFALYAAAVRRVWTEPAGRSWWPLLLWAAAFRVALIPAGLPEATRWADLGRDLAGPEAGYSTFLLYDNDVWRYLWDGHVTAHGIDPYRWSPAEIVDAADRGEAWAEALLAEERWDQAVDSLSYETFRTVYPPLAQGLFALSHGLAPGSVAVWKLLVIALDLVAAMLLAVWLARLRGRPREALVYAWNPLAIKEIAGSGHVDSLLVACLVATALALARRRSRLAVVAFAASILAKLTPLLLAPFVLRRAGWKQIPLLTAALGLGLWPVWTTLPRFAEALAAFSSQWMFNPGPWAAVRWLAGTVLGGDGRGVATGFTFLATLALLAWAWRRDEGSDHGLARAALLALGGYLVTSATVMPWYLLWVLPFAAVVRSRAWIAWTGLSFLSYWIYVDQIEHPGWLALEYGLLAAFVVADLRRGRTTGPGTAPP